MTSLSEDLDSRVTCLVLETLEHGYWGAHAEPGHKEELDRADRWQDPTARGR
jgi:hypothetical protein